MMRIDVRSWLAPAGGIAFLLAAIACSEEIDDGSSGSTTTDSGTDGSAEVDGGTDAATIDCSGETTHIGKVTCNANAFLATLTAEQRATANPAFTDKAARTKWSNLPGQDRPGVAMGDLGAASQTAALALMNVVLSAEGVADLAGIRAADDYLNAQGGGTGGGMGDGGGMGMPEGGGPPGGGDGGGPGGGGAGGGYGAGNYHVAILGSPGAIGSFEVMFGGHHLAFNVTYIDGVGYPVPNHQGVEPKGSFTQAGATYAPLDPEAAALKAVFDALPDLSAAYLAGQTYGDVLIGPVEYGTGTSAAVKAKYPTGENRGGVVVSTLPQATQDLVTAAIKQWVEDYDPAISSKLVAEYTSAAAYADTHVAWAGTEAAGVDVDINNTYMRIDGPRVWIELDCQGGVVIQGKTHFHTIYRDKQLDYGNTL